VAGALIFPGQGAQKVGMASAFVNGFKAGLEVVEEIEDAISFKLSRVVAEGPIEELTRTENVQPAIFMVSMACVRILEEEYGYVVEKRCKLLAGHSLGEYSALCTAGAFSIADAARIVRKRGELMADDTHRNNDAYCMAALLGICASDIESVMLRYNSGDSICVIANDNSPSEVVISGHRKAVATAIEEIKQSFDKARAIELNTSGPFHSPLMAKAAIEFDKYLSEHHSFCNDLVIPVIMNVDTKPLTEKNRIHEYLVRQIIGRVRWRETSELLVSDPDIDRISEIAPGRILTKMMKRTYPDANITALETIAQMEELEKEE
jgi:[acyl-carrier-protein] S-malonyltransferase